mmetsp:Transcript_16319/g.48931  ORF Transcript_16319/g.48931 Transcript_16319/m.48931 type:complete len:120 (+) Transcript_16319:361-720(+)
MSQIKDLFRKYGKVAVGVHLTVYATTFAGLYTAVKNKVDVESTLVKYGLLSERDPDTPPEGWFQKTLAGGGSAALLAFLCNKALMPVRAPITIGLTPMVARAFRQHAASKGKVSKMSQT